MTVTVEVEKRPAGSVSDGLPEKQHGAAPWAGFRIEDEQAVDGAGHPVHRLGSGVLQREGVLLYAAQGCAQVGHHLLRADDPDRVGGAARVGGELAAAARGENERAGLGDCGDAVDDEFGTGGQPSDLVGAGGTVDGQSAGPDGVVLADSVDVLVDAGQPEGLGTRTGASSPRAMSPRPVPRSSTTTSSRWPTPPASCAVS